MQKGPDAKVSGPFSFDPIAPTYYHCLQAARSHQAQGILLQSNSHYTRTAVALHWIVAVLIIAGGTLAVVMVGLHMSPRKLKFFAYHKWIGMTVLALVLVRLLWRSTHRAPPDEPMPRWQALAAHATHWLLYLLMLAVPIVGWLYTSAAGYPVVYLKIWQLPDLVSKNRDLADVLVRAHHWLGWTLLVVVGLHAAAALKHHLIDRDATLKRMLVWRRIDKVGAQ
jgi:cytochrome b561